MSTHDNAPPPDGWRPEPRKCPIDDCGVCETPQQSIAFHLPESIELGEN